MGVFSRLFGSTPSQNPDAGTAGDDPVSANTAVGWAPSATSSSPGAPAPAVPGPPAPPDAPQVVTLFSRERVMALLDADNTIYEVDEDGDLAGRWGDDIYQFVFYLDEVDAAFQIRGRSIQPVPPEHAEDLQILVEDWNRDHYWPKALTRELDTGLHPCGEVTIGYPEGATDAQIRQHITCAISTTHQLLDTVRDRFGIPPLED